MFYLLFLHKTAHNFNIFFFPFNKTAALSLNVDEFNLHTWGFFEYLDALFQNKFIKIKEEKVTTGMTQVIHCFLWS